MSEWAVFTAETARDLAASERRRRRGCAERKGCVELRSYVELRVEAGVRMSAGGRNPKVLKRHPVRERLQQAMGFYVRIFEGICKPEKSMLSQELSLTRRVAWQTMRAQVDSDGFWQG